MFYKQIIVFLLFFSYESLEITCYIHFLLLLLTFFLALEKLFILFFCLSYTQIFFSPHKSRKFCIGSLKVLFLYYVFCDSRLFHAFMFLVLMFLCYSYKRGLKFFCQSIVVNLEWKVHSFLLLLHFIIYHDAMSSQSVFVQPMTNRAIKRSPWSSRGNLNLSVSYYFCR